MRHRVVIPILCVVIVSAFLLQFFRDPERTIPQQEGIIVSPADGRVIEIRTIKGGDIPTVEKNGETIPLPELAGYIAHDMTILVIFMSPLDVHVNRAPIKGRIEKVMHVPGRFYSAKNPVYAKNERMISVIRGDETVIVIQVAGKMARRIHFYKKEGAFVERGERIGMISLGSQVALIFPHTFSTSVSVGDTVYAGETIIAAHSRIREHISSPPPPHLPR